MAIDPSAFHPINVTDTCAVWNVLSSTRLYAAAMDANCDFCITTFVHYECLVKARRVLTDTDQELRQRLIREQTRGRFRVHSCAIGDLQAIQLLESRKKLGKGELSSIAFAMKIRQAVLTDDQKARRLAESSGHRMTQTTPHLHSWLIFTGRLTDADHALVIYQHNSMAGSLEPHLRHAYELALQCKLNVTRETAETTAPMGQPSSATSNIAPESAAEP